MNKHMYIRIIAILISIVILFSNRTNEIFSGTYTTVMADEAKDTPVVIINYGDGSSRKYMNVDNDMLDNFKTELTSIMDTPQKFIKTTKADMIYKLQVSLDGQTYSITKYDTIHECYMELNGIYYEADDKLDELISALVNSDAAVYMEPDEYLRTYTYQCDEPTTNDEYIIAAERITGQWLDYLQSVDGEFAIGSYSFNGESEFVADGYVDDKREWVVDVRFDVNGIDDNSVFHDDTGYNQFYHYYFGPCVILRLRWENGICAVVDYEGSYVGAIYDGRLTDGLYGIMDYNSMSYPTFYEFMNDYEHINQLLTNGITDNYAGETLSHNVMMLSDGSIYYADIIAEQSSEGILYDNDGFCHAQMSRRFYDASGSPTYSSPVSYSDAKQAANNLKLKKDFKLLFDDYNNDGNPDYTIKIDEDENGSTYYIENMANDGTPRADPYNMEVYMAGAYDDSILLQRNEDGYVVWNMDSAEGGMRSNIELDNYRMYSQRYYEPEPLNIYEPDTKHIVCYFWNNTSEVVSWSDTYNIERFANGKWELAAEHLTCERGQAEAYRYGSISFDVSSIQDTVCYEYRIVLDISSNDSTQTVYGGFFMGNPNEKADSSNETSVIDGQWYYFADNPVVSKDNSGNYTITLKNEIASKETAESVSTNISFAVWRDNSWKETNYHISVADTSQYNVDIPYGESLTLKLAKDDYEEINMKPDLNFIMAYLLVHTPMIQAEHIVERLQYTMGNFAADFLDIDVQTFSQYIFWMTLYDNEHTEDAEELKSGEQCRMEIGIGEWKEYVYWEVE